MNAARVQSTLDPAPGSAAWPIDELGVVLYSGAAVILAVVCILALAGVVAGPRRVDARRWLLVGGLILPAVLLVAVFLYALGIGHALVAPASPGALRVHLSGKRWSS